MYGASGIRTNVIYPASITVQLPGENARKCRLPAAVLFSLTYVVRFGNGLTPSPSSRELHNPCALGLSSFVEPRNEAELLLLWLRVS